MEAARIDPLTGGRTFRGRAIPFLKWAGGKRQVLPYLLAALPRRFARYHEPFVGGGALFFELHARGFLDAGAVLSDGNLRLVRTWRAVRDAVDELVERLRVHAEGLEAGGADYYYAVRAAIPDEGSDAELGAWLIFLNRTGFNGLYRVNRKGGFNVPFGRYKNPVVCDEPRLRAASAVLRDVDIRHEDFRAVGERAEPGDLVYFDPPYVPLNATSSFTSYTEKGFGPDDQVALRDLARALKRRKVRVMLSNHDTPEVRKLYARGFKLTPIRVGRAINSVGSGRGKVGELVIT